MALPVTPRINSAVPDANRSGDLTKKALDPLLKDPFLSGVTVAAVPVTAAIPFVINHGLGRVPIGYVVTAIAAGGGFVVLQSSNAITIDPTKQICLLPSASGTISLRIF